MNTNDAQDPAAAARFEQIEALVREYHARVRGFLFSRLHSREVAEDVAQEVFLAAFRSLDNYDASRPAWPWLIGICRNKLHEYWREQLHELPTESLDAFVVSEELAREEIEEQRTTGGDRVEALRLCIDRLDADARVLLRLTYEEGMNSDSVAAKLKRKAGAVRMALLRIRGWLQACVARRMEAVPT